MLGAYTFWDGIWTMIIFFAYLVFLTWVILLMIDNFRRQDHSGWAKAVWALFIIFLPIVGAFTYTIVRPDTAGDYGYEPGHGSQAGAPASTASELTRLNELRHEGAITDAEFADLKAKAIAAS
jgi:Phospholipase_D-nuclease N-terminal